jgi:hypothetical protein
MRIEYFVRVRTKSRNHIRTESNIRDEMAVHHIEMNPITSIAVNGLDFRAELGKVSR